MNKLTMMIRNLFRRKDVGPGILTDFMNYQGSSARPTVHNMSRYLQRYADQAWVYACIRVIQTKAAGVRLKVYREINGKPEHQENHPLQTLLDSVNDWMNGYDLIESTFGFLELAGNAYWLLDGMTAEGKPSLIFPLVPSRITIKADRKKYVTGYIYKSHEGAEEQTFDVSEIIHFKYWNPLDEFYGMAPISAARESSDTLAAADKFNRVFFENSARLDGVLTSDSQILDANKTRIAQEWKKRHQGVKNAFKTAILDNGLKWQSISASHTDMMFPELKRMSREDVLSAYGIPPIMVGVYDEANYSNAREQRRIFWVDCIIPRLRKIESVLNEKLAKPYDPDIWVEFDLSGEESIKEDEKVKSEVAQIQTTAGIRTINEIRKDMNLQPVPWGDTWNAPFNLAPIGSPDEEKPPVPPAPPPPPPKEDPEPSEDTPPKKALSDIDSPAPDPDKLLREGAANIREKVWYAFKGLTEGLERKWLPVLRKLFSELEREMIRVVRDNDAVAVGRQIKLDNFKTLHQKIWVILFDRSRALKIFSKEGGKLLELTMAAKWEEESDRYDLGVKFDLNNPLVSQWINDKKFKFAKEVVDTTEEALKIELSEAFQSGETITQIEDRVGRVFDIARGPRTRLIARTEVIGASNNASVMAYQEAGIDEMEWITARDEKVRPTHQIEGEETKIGISFSNGLRYPGDPAGGPEEVCNCRCTIVPVIKK